MLRSEYDRIVTVFFRVFFHGDLARRPMAIGQPLVTGSGHWLGGAWPYGPGPRPPGRPPWASPWVLACGAARFLRFFPSRGETGFLTADGVGCIYAPKGCGA